MGTKPANHAVLNFLGKARDSKHGLAQDRPQAFLNFLGKARYSKQVVAFLV